MGAGAPAALILSKGGRLAAARCSYHRDQKCDQLYWQNQKSML
jgi:hypothetical protein